MFAVPAPVRPATTRRPRRRRWRGLDLGATRVYLEADTERVRCAEHGVVVAHVPWARPGARFTTAFEDTAAWLVCHATLTVVATLLRVAWRSVSGIVTRVVADRAGQLDRLAGLRRIGIDEISYRKGQRYLLVVVDHDTGRLVWAAKGRDQADPGQVLRRPRPGAGRAAHPRLRRRGRVDPRPSSPTAPRRPRCAWTPSTSWPGPPRPSTRYAAAGRPACATRGRADAGRHHQAHPLGAAEEPAAPDRRPTHHAGRHPGRQRPALPRLPAERATPGDLRLPSTSPPPRALLAGWIAWARRCRLDAFVTLAKTIKNYRQLILNAVEHGLSNARSEATNTHLRLLTRRAYGYHSPEALIAMADLTRGGLCPPLPGRS